MKLDQYGYPEFEGMRDKTEDFVPPVSVMPTFEPLTEEQMRAVREERAKAREIAERRERYETHMRARFMPGRLPVSCLSWGRCVPAGVDVTTYRRAA